MIYWNTYYLLAALAIIVAIAVGLIYNATQVLRNPSLRKFTLLWSCAVGCLALNNCMVINIAREREWFEATKEIETTLNGILFAVEENDFDRALKFVSEKAPQTRGLVERNRNAVEIKKVEVKGVQLRGINLNKRPPCARVALSVSVKGTATAWPTPIKLPYRVELDLDEVEFRREKDGVWRLQDRYVVKSTEL